MFRLKKKLKGDLLAALPVELQLSVCENFDPMTLILLSMTCKAMYAVATDSKIWRPHVFRQFLADEKGWRCRLNSNRLESAVLEEKETPSVTSRPQILSTLRARLQSLSQESRECKERIAQQEEKKIWSHNYIDFSKNRVLQIDRNIEVITALLKGHLNLTFSRVHIPPWEFLNKNAGGCINGHGISAFLTAIIAAANPAVEASHDSFSDAQFCVLCVWRMEEQNIRHSQRLPLHMHFLSRFEFQTIEFELEQIRRDIQNTHNLRSLEHRNHGASLCRKALEIIDKVFVILAKCSWSGKELRCAEFSFVLLFFS
jgi:hypothetical protein